MILGDLATELLLDLKWRLNDGSYKARGNMPFDVAMEQPYARVVGAEAKDNVTIGVHEDGVTTHRSRRELRNVARIVETCVVIAPMDELEGMAVKVEGVLSGVVVVEDKLNDLVMA